MFYGIKIEMKKKQKGIKKNKMAKKNKKGITRFFDFFTSNVYYVLCRYFYNLQITKSLPCSKSHHFSHH